MVAELFSAPFVSERQLSHSSQLTQGYYRSKLFNANFTKNSLVAAAGPILSLLERLCLASTLPPIADIRENIEHELQAFHSRVAEKNYMDDYEMLAHYLLCATIDELIGKNYLRLYGKAVDFKAFTPPHVDAIGPEKRFFDIVNFIVKTPNQSLDLIELAYYCLITGFEGEHHNRMDGRQSLDEWIETLYQSIKDHRVHQSYTLFHHEPKPPQKKPVFLKTLLIGFFGLSVFLCVSFYVSHSLLNHTVTSFQIAHQTAIKWD